MSNTQLYIAIGVPMIFNFILYLSLGASLRSEMRSGFAAVNRQFDAVNQRFDDMRDLWRAELHRVEGVIDARLSHLEGR